MLLLMLNLEKKLSGGGKILTGGGGAEGGMEGERDREVGKGGSGDLEPPCLPPLRETITRDDDDDD